MNSVQENKNELEAAVRYCESAISRAQATIESMEFRQEMAKKQYSEQTGREQALEAEVVELKSELDKLRKEKEASSGPCGCQAYRDIEEAQGRAGGEVELLQRTIADLEAQVNALEQPERPTMPVIPKDVAIAIFREGTLFGVEAACDEIQGESINISESDYVGDFSITFERDIDLDDHIDFDWVRSKIGDYDEDNVTANLEVLCAKNNFECRIHGIDDNTIDLTKKNDLPIHGAPS